MSLELESPAVSASSPDAPPIGRRPPAAGLSTRRPLLTPDERALRVLATQKRADRKRARLGDFTNRGRRYHKMRCMTPEQINKALKMHARGRSQADIAKTMNVSQSSISRLLEKYPDTRGIAAATLRTEAEKMAQHVAKAAELAAKKGNADPALEVLDRLEVLTARSKTSGNGAADTKVMVVVGAVPGSAQNLHALPVEITKVAALPPVKDAE